MLERLNILPVGMPNQRVRLWNRTVVAGELWVHVIGFCNCRFREQRLITSTKLLLEEDIALSHQIPSSIRTRLPMITLDEEAETQTR